MGCKAWCIIVVLLVTVRRGELLFGGVRVMFTWRSTASARGVRKWRPPNGERVRAGQAQQNAATSVVRRRDAMPSSNGAGACPMTGMPIRGSLNVPLPVLHVCQRRNSVHAIAVHFRLSSHLHNTSTNSTLSLSQQERN